MLASVERAVGRGVRRAHFRDPSDIDGLTVWLEADRGVVLDASGNVSEWRDQSGRGNHASQGTAGARPTYATVAGRPAVQTTATPRYLTIPQTTDTDHSSSLGLTVYLAYASSSAVANAFVVGKWDSADANLRSWTIGTNNASAAISGSLARETGTGIVRTAAGGDASSGAAQVHALRFDPTGQIYQTLLGTLTGPTAVAGLTTISQVVQIGAGSPIGSLPTVADIRALLIVRRYLAHGSAEDVAIRDYLRRRWGTP